MEFLIWVQVQDRRTALLPGKYVDSVAVDDKNNTLNKNGIPVKKIQLKMC